MSKIFLPNGTVFEYEKEVLSNETNSAITPENGKRILEQTHKLFQSRNMEFFLVFGTLLGAVRDKNIIKGDEDVDVACVDENSLLYSLPYFKENGLFLVRAEKGHLYSFRMDSQSYIDVYIFKNLNFSIWKFYCISLYKFIIPKKYFRSFSKIDFLGKQYTIPSNPEDLLAFWYGKNWRTPVRGHKFIYEVKSAYHWHNFKRYVIPIIQKMIGWYHWRHFIKNIED